MPQDDEVYELYAIRYASAPGRRMNESVLFYDPHNGPMPMDYFVWLARSPKRCVLIDLGYQEELAAEKKHTYHFNPVEGLKALGVSPDQVDEIIVSHMHWDHVGNFDLFPNARLHIQNAELMHCCGKYMQYWPLRKSFRIEDVTSVLGRLYAGQVQVYEGEAEPCPGITLHHIGGHAPGLQVARVRTKRGQVVVASDALHFFYNFEAQNPFPTVVNVAEMVEGWHTILKLAGGDKNRLVPGHDPIVFTSYPPVLGAAEGMAVRLDEAPDME